MHLCPYMQRAYHLPLTEILTVLDHCFTELLVKKITSILTAAPSLTSLHFPLFVSATLSPFLALFLCSASQSRILQNFSFTCSATLPTYKLEEGLLSLQTSFLWLPLLLNSLSKTFLSLFGPLCRCLTHSALFHPLESFLVLSALLSMSLLMQPYVNLLSSFKRPIYWLFINPGWLSSLPGLFWTPSLSRTGAGCPYCR